MTHRTMEKASSGPWWIHVCGKCGPAGTQLYGSTKSKASKRWWHEHAHPATAKPAPPPGLWDVLDRHQPDTDTDRAGAEAMAAGRQIVEQHLATHGHVTICDVRDRLEQTGLASHQIGALFNQLARKGVLVAAGWAPSRNIKSRNDTRMVRIWAQPAHLPPAKTTPAEATP